MSESIEVPASEVLALMVDMTKLVATVFEISRSEAGRRIKAGAVEVIEATNGKIDYRKTATLREPLMVYSKGVSTYLRWSRIWRKIHWQLIEPSP